MKRRPLAYITAPWGCNEFENIEKAGKYCRKAYEAGFSPFCPVLLYPTFLKEKVAQEHKDMKDMSREMLRRSSILIVCGGVSTEDVLDDIATAQRLRIATTTLEGVLDIRGLTAHE